MEEPYREKAVHSMIYHRTNFHNVSRDQKPSPVTSAACVETGMLAGKYTVTTNRSKNHSNSLKSLFHINYQDFHTSVLNRKLLHGYWATTLQIHLASIDVPFQGMLNPDRSPQIFHTLPDEVQSFRSQILRVFQRDPPKTQGLLFHLLLTCQ